MEPTADSPKLPNMVMCGDHPSFTKTALNSKTDLEEKIGPPLDQAKISPSASRTGYERSEQRARVSEHVLRALELRRPRPGDAARHEDLNLSTNRAVVQAALGSARWPPYLVLAWLLVLALTHSLHCLATLLERALPNVRKFCMYFREWTEAAWRKDSECSRLLPLALACVTSLLYTSYACLYAMHAAVLWAVEPLAGDERETEAVVTDYTEHN